MNNILEHESQRFASERRRWRQIDALRWIMQGVVRVFANRRIDIRFPGSIGLDAPAWTDGEDIYFNKDKIEAVFAKVDSAPADQKDGLLRKAIRLLKGLAYHELEHILFTPRRGSRPIDRLTSASREWRWAWNALEDQRIETLFTAMFPPTVPYHTVPVYEWIVDNKDGTGKEVLLLWGRKYLPSELRAQSYHDFAAKYSYDLADRAAKIIDRYLTVMYPASEMLGISLVDQMAALLNELKQIDDPGNGGFGPGDFPGQPTPDQQGSTTQGGGNTDILQKGQPSQKQQNKASKKAREQAEAEAKAEADAAAKDSDAKTDDSKPHEIREELPMGPAETVPEGESQGKGEGSKGEASDPSTEQSPEELGDPGIGTGSAPQSITDQAQAALDEAEANIDIASDIDKAVELFKRIMSQSDVGALAAMWEPRPIDANAMKLYRSIASRLQELRLDLEAERIRRQPNGRVNPRRAMMRRPFEIDVFDSYDTANEEAGGVEAVILVDLSGSMRSKMGDASAALWALKMAFDEIDVRTTVLGYASESTTLYKAGESVTRSAQRLYGAGGGTDPWPAFSQAVNILSKSSAENRVLVSITDGGWSSHPGGPDAERRIMDALHSANTTSLFLRIGGGAFSGRQHYHQVTANLTDAKSISKAVGDAVAKVMERAIQNSTTS